MDKPYISCPKIRQSELFIVILRKNRVDAAGICNLELTELKQLKHIFNWTLWTICGLCITLMGLVQMPFVQTWLGEKASEAMSNMLGTQVSVGRVDLGFFNRIIIDDAVILDQRHKEMLRVARLTARVDLIALAEGQVSISSAQLFGAHATLSRDSANAIANYQFLLDSLASRDTTQHTPLNLSVNSFIMRRSSISYDQNDAPRTDGIFNYKHLNIRDISAHIILKTLTNDSLNLNVKRLTLREQSGLNVQRLAFKAEASSKGARLEGFSLQLPDTHIYIDSVQAKYDVSQLKQTLSYKGNISQTRIALRDFVPLLPKLADYSQEVELQAQFQGTGTTAIINHLRISESNQLLLEGSGWATQLDDRPLWNAEIDQLSVSKSLIAKLQQNMSGMPEVVTRLGGFSLSAQVEGQGTDEIDVHSQLSSDIGHLNMQLQLSERNHFSGNVETNDLQLSKLLDNNDFGLLATKAFIEGTTKKIAIQGDVSLFDFKKYRYKDISIDGNVSENSFEGKIRVDDPNLMANIEGLMSKGQHIRLTGFLNRVSPQNLNLSQHWGNTKFAAVIDADFTATTLNDAEGSVDVDDFVMTNEDGDELLHIDNMHLKSGYDEGIHYMKLTGDPIEAELKGQFDWATLPQTLMRTISTRLPTLPGLPKDIAPTGNDFGITLNMTDSRWLKELLHIDLQLNAPLTVNMSVSDGNERINVDGQLPSFSYNGTHYSGGSISISSPSDTLYCDLQLDQQREDEQYLRLDLHAKAADNNLQTALRWGNMANNDLFSGELNTLTSLYKNLDGQAEAHVRVLPSRLMMQNTEWDIEPCDILYSTRHLLVDHFLVRHDDRHITIDGVAGDQPTDTLSVSLQDIDVAYVQNMLDFHPVEFGGNASGTATLISALGKLEAYADLIVNRFTFEQGRMGTLSVRADLNQELEQIDLHATANDGPDARTLINGYISPQRDELCLDIEGLGTHIDFLHSFTSAFLEDISGQAYGSVRVAGPLSNINLTGQLVVSGQATVTPLYTTYQLHNDTVNFIPDHIVLDSLPIHDRYNNTAYLSGSIDHEHLTNMTFDLSVNTERLLAYDEPQQPGQQFYGTIMAQGSVDMHGRPGETIINADVVPLEGTVFTYNVAKPDAISTQEFITWNERNSNSSSWAVQQEDSKQEADTQLNNVQSSSDLYLNIAINATPQAQLRLLMDAKTGDYITLRGDGALKSTYYNKGSFRLFGNYIVDSGTYDVTIQNIIRKKFQFQQGGTISFTGEPFESAINLQAIYTVPAVSLADLALGESFSSNTIRVNCLMNITGTAEQPQVDFDLQMPTVNADEQQMIRSVLASQEETRQQVVYLLGIGRFYTAGINNADAQQQDQTQLAMQSFLSGTLSTQFSQLLSQVINTDSWNIGANISTGTEGWRNADYEGTISGRMLDNRLLFNGQFGYRDNATQANPSFIGDFDLRYLLTPKGNLALKVYNQTNDRYFTRSSLNTQGIGLIMKRDFNGLVDLLSPLKKKRNRKKE